MLVLDGAYAPTILTVRMHADKLGHENRAKPYYRLLRVLEGSFRLELDGGLHKAQDGDVCLIPPTVPFQVHSHAQAQAQWISFTVMATELEQSAGGRFARRIRAGAPPQPGPQHIWGCRLPVVQPAAVSEQTRDLIGLIVSESWQSQVLRMICQQRLAFVLERLVLPELVTESAWQNSGHHPIARVHAVVHACLPALRGASDIASYLDISLSQLNKTYRAATSGRDTPAAFLRRYRLAETARLVLEGNLPLKGIAKTVGFRDEQALYKAWMRVYELPPKKWRLAQRYK